MDNLPKIVAELQDRVSYVYVQSEPTLWTVGFYEPDGEWTAESDHATPERAAARVRYLNGGKDISTNSIVTRHVNPPIPIRNHDWEAIRDGWDEGDPIGTGATEREAVQDLLDQEEGERSHINMDYLKWLRKLFKNSLVRKKPDIAMAWLRDKTWRRYYLQNFTPQQAEVELLPF